MKDLYLKDSKENLIILLKNDPIDRNSKICSFLKLINQANNNVITIDGAWGSGKTFFIKQAKLISDELNSPHKIHREPIIQKFITENKLQSFYVPTLSIYFDAWDSDFSESPIISIIRVIMRECSYNPNLDKKDIKEQCNQLLSQIINLFAPPPSSALLIYIKDYLFSYFFAKNKFLASTNKELIHQKLTKLLNLIFDNMDIEKMVIYIDELDRCKPTFAVDLLEQIKHHFNHPKITFILSTNMIELQHTIEAAYGAGFNGYRYLEKLIDFSIGLPTPDIDKYISSLYPQTIEQIPPTVYKEILTHISTSLNLQLREISKLVYFSNLLLKDVWFQKISSDPHKKVLIFSLTLFVPLLLALKISDITKFHKFINGSAYEILHNIVLSSNIIKTYIEELWNEEDILDDGNSFFLDFYKNLFNKYNARVELSKNNIPHNQLEWIIYPNIANELLDSINLLKM